MVHSIIVIHICGHAHGHTHTHTCFWIYWKSSAKFFKTEVLGYICLLQEPGQNPLNVALKFVWAGQNFPILVFQQPILHTRGQTKGIRLSKLITAFLSYLLTSAVTILRRRMELYIFVQDLKMKDDMKELRYNKTKIELTRCSSTEMYCCVLALKTSSLWSVNRTSRQNLLQRIPVIPVFQMNAITLWHQTEVNT